MPRRAKAAKSTSVPEVVSTAPRRHQCTMCGGFGFVQKHEPVTGGMVKGFDGQGGMVKGFDGQGGAIRDFAGEGMPTTASSGTGRRRRRGGAAMVQPTTATSGTGGKAKRAPTAWQKLVKKHLNSGKSFKDALAAAKAEYRG